MDMGLHAKLAQCHWKIRRGTVWCQECGTRRDVDPESCFASGWPTCCGYTMSLDSPKERARFAEPTS